MIGISATRKHFLTHSTNISASISKPGLYTIECPPAAAFTVTDYFLQLGFFRQDGSYDWSKELLSYSEDALTWGRNLFQFYVEQAEPFTL